MKDYVVLDLEWNQSPEGKEGSVENLPFEIIEIGAVRMDAGLRETSQFHVLVRPKVYRQIHYKISEVTHVEMEELLSRGEEFEIAVKRFLDWCGTDYILCTWGSMDLTELQRNMTYYEVDNPFEKPLFYYDIQKIYSLLYGDGKTKPSLDQAVAELGVLEERPFHRALDDAYYTGRVMAHMEFERMKAYYSMDYYRLPDSREEEVYLVFPDYSKYVSRTFDTKEEAIADKTVTDMVCYKCRRMLRKKIRWFSSNQRFYFGLALCPEHGFVKGKIRMKRAEDGRVYVVKTLKLVDEQGAGKIYEKREETKKKRNEKNRQRRNGRKEQ